MAGYVDQLERTGGGDKIGDYENAIVAVSEEITQRDLCAIAQLIRTPACRQYQLAVLDRHTGDQRQPVGDGAFLDIFGFAETGIAGFGDICPDRRR